MFGLERDVHANQEATYIRSAKDRAVVKSYRMLSGRPHSVGAHLQPPPLCGRYCRPLHAVAERR